MSEKNTVRGTLEGKTLFITGATGFLGQPLVEKILRIVPGVGRLYLLIRPKKQLGGQTMSPDERLHQELFRSSVFDHLRGLQGPAFEEFLKNKVFAVAGDTSQPQLGMDAETIQDLQGRVDVVINSAAVVSFDAPLNEALEMNTLSASRVSRFANACKGALLVHVSTAFVCGVNKKVAPETIYHTATPEEASEPYPPGKFGDVDREIKQLKEMIGRAQKEARSPAVDRQLKEALLKRFRKSGRGGRNSRRREKIENLREKWVSSRLAREGLAWARKRGWNDTYTYTKAMGEQMVLKTRSRTAPTIIVRPSVIEGSLAEPTPGWLDGLRMADPLIIAIGKNRLRSLPMDPDVPLDLIPVDMVVNALLAAIPAARRATNLKVYHVATGSTSPVTLGDLYELVYSYFLNNPMVDKVGQPIQTKRVNFLPPEKFRLQYKIKKTPLVVVEWCLERLPSFFLSAQKLRRKVATARAAYEKLYYYGTIYEPYLNLACRFETNNIVSLFSSLSEEEKNLLDFDVQRLNWRHYIQNVHIPGLRKHILKQEGSSPTSPFGDSPQVPPIAKTIPQLLEVTASRLPHKTALQIKRKGQWCRLTYQDLQQGAQKIAGSFGGMGLKKGDRVVLYSENQPEWGLAYLAATTAGLIVVPLDAQTWEKEVWGVARFTKAKALLVSSRCFEKLKPSSLQENEKRQVPVKLLDLNCSCEPFVDTAYPRSTTVDVCSPPPPLPRVLPDDPASIIFTTGTAADPKGAVHTHSNFLGNFLGVNCYLPVQETDQITSVLPLYHALEFTCGFLMAIYGGATVTYLHSLKPKVILGVMREVGATCMLGVPTLYALIRDDIERRVMKGTQSSLKSGRLAISKRFSNIARHNWGKEIGRQLFARAHKEVGNQIRFFVSGGSALGTELYEDFQALGLPIYEGYGLTETAPVLTVNPLGESRKGSAGKPLPGVELQIFRPDEHGVGEVIVQTSSLMLEYYGNPKATNAVIRDGWFHTGDLGRLDAEGYLYITGRIKDVIVTGAGKNVYPADLEAIYQALPGVAEVCVLGVKSGLTEDVHAIFAPLQNSPDQDLPAIKKSIQREIQQLARELPSYHRLQQVHFWEAPLPREDSGQLQRVAIRDRLEYQLAGETPASPATSSHRAMTSNNSKKALLAELSRLAGIPEEEVEESNHLYTDLGLDSLMAIELLLYIEHTFDVVVPDEKATEVQTVGQLLDEVFSRGAFAKQPPAEKLSRKKIRSARPYSSRSFINRALFSLALRSFSGFLRKYFSLTVRTSGSPSCFSQAAQPYIIAANHNSHLDAPALLAAVYKRKGIQEARKLHVLGARDYFFDNSLKSWFFSTFLNVVPVEREETSLAGLRLVKEILASGENVLIFPEGTRSRTGQLQAFKAGLGLMALELNAPIVPAFIEGTYQALPVGSTMPCRQKLSVVFGSRLEMDYYEEQAAGLSRDEVYRQIARDTQRAVEAISSISANEEVL